MTSRKVAGYLKARLKADAIFAKIADVENSTIKPLQRKYEIAMNDVARRTLALTGGQLAAARRAYDEATAGPEPPSEPRTRGSQGV